MRYDEESQVYRDCPFCHGVGCLSCPGEAKKAYKRQFPDGPKPIATYNIDSPSDMKNLQEFFKGEVDKEKESQDYDCKCPDPCFLHNTFGLS